MHDAAVIDAGAVPFRPMMLTAAAQFVLGAMYHEGEGVPQDYKEAAK